MKVKSLELFTEHIEDGGLHLGYKSEWWGWEWDRVEGFRVALSVQVLYDVADRRSDPHELWKPRDLEVYRYANAQKLNEGRVFQDPNEARPTIATWRKWFSER